MINLPSGLSCVPAVCLIPARAGSKGVPGKNTKPLAGGPSCIARAIDFARALRVFDLIVVSTNDPIALGQAVERQATIIPRPHGLATDDTPMVPVIEHVRGVLAPKTQTQLAVLCLLQPTSPLRRAATVLECFARLKQGPSSAVTGYVADARYAPERTLPTAEYSDKLWAVSPCNCRGDAWDPAIRQAVSARWVPDGTAYVALVPVHRPFAGWPYPIACVETPEEDRLSIDTLADWETAEARVALR